MNKAEFLDKHRAGNYLINDEFESDLDALLKEVAEHAWYDTVTNTTPYTFEDYWKRLTSE